MKYLRLITKKGRKVKVTIGTSLSTKRYVNVNASQGEVLFTQQNTENTALADLRTGHEDAATVIFFNNSFRQT